LEFYPVGEGLVHVYDASTSRHFKLGVQEVGWLKLLDGTKTPDQLVGQIPFEYFQRFLSTVERLGLLDQPPAPESKPAFNPLKIKLMKFDPGRLLDGNRRFALLYRQALNWISLPVFLLNVAAIIILFPQIRDAIQNFHFSLAILPAYLLTIFTVGLVHELSHALVATSFGAKVPRIGFMLFFLQPAFYADVSAINLFSDRKSRVQTLLAGIQANNILAFIGIIAALFAFQSALFPYIVFFVAMNFMLMFINLVPFVEYDGYYIFQDLIAEPRFNRNAFVGTLSGSSGKIEHRLYFILSQMYQLSLIVSGLLLLRIGANQLFTGMIVDIAFLILIVTAAPALMLTRLRTLK
jgi:putative peptide zinc metalloprotease protein